MTITQAHGRWLIVAMIASCVGMIAWSVYLLGPLYEVQCFISELDHPNVAVRISAARSLRWYGSAAEPAVPVLSQLLTDDDPVMRSEAANALCAIGSRVEQAIPVLIQLLENGEPTYTWGTCGRSETPVDSSAASQLIQVGPRAIPQVTEALSSDQVGIRAWAAEVLGQIAVASPAAEQGLVNAMKDESPLVRAAAAWSHWRIRHEPEVTFEVLIDGLGAKADNVQRALGSLRNAMGCEAVPALVRALEHREAAVRIGAACALRNHGYSSFVYGKVTGPCCASFRDAQKPLIAATQDSDSGVREAAVTALGYLRFDAETVVDALTNSLNDEIDAVRECAATSLGEFGQAAQSAAASLMAATDDKADRVRQSATEALARIRSSTATMSGPIVY